tara:strand:+ start:156 stop:269 length:114 start_codon:yes stop_codon:yes gene_type:complete
MKEKTLEKAFQFFEKVGRNTGKTQKRTFKLFNLIHYM